MVSKRIDPENGRLYTFDELAAFYKGKYKQSEIQEYWAYCRPELKVDPNDGYEYTWGEISHYYKGKMSTAEIEAYWNEKCKHKECTGCCPCLPRVPVTVLTGFLGSGKTTLLNHILSDNTHGLRFAIIENEFGEVGVDEKLIAGGKTKVDEEVIEVMNGCICCTVRGDLVEALKRLYDKVSSFDAVLIETTGMADPAPVAQTFCVEPEIKKMYRLDGIVTVVDAAHVVSHLDEEKPEGAENESVEQIAFADRIILNKCDLLLTNEIKTEAAEVTCGEAKRAKVDGDTRKDESTTKPEPVKSDDKIVALEERIKSMNPTAPIIRTNFSKVDPRELLGISAFSIERVLEMDPEFLNSDGTDHVHDETISSVAWSFPGLELNVNKLQRWIGNLMKDLGTELFRYKGVLAVKGCEEKFIFQGVHMVFHGGFSSEVMDESELWDESGGYVKNHPGLWKEGEARECRFVFIGKEIKQKHAEKLRAEFLECAAEETLRFKVGDMVMARRGEGYEKAKVLKLWDDGYCYRLELQNEDKTWVLGPIDVDDYVKSVE